MMEKPRAEARRRRVLEAAVEAIADVGAEALTLADIASRAGMSAGHILYYFGNKDAILAETLAWSEHDLAVRRRQRLAEPPSDADPIALFVDLYLPHPGRDSRWNLWTQIQARPPTDPDQLRALDELSELWRADLAPVLPASLRGQEVRREVARASCYLLDGIALDLILGARTDRASAVRLATESIRQLARPQASR